MLKNLNQGGKNWLLLTKGHGLTTVLPGMKCKRQILTEKKDDADFRSDSDSDDGIYSGSSHLPYVVFDLQLLGAALAKIARCNGLAGTRFRSKSNNWGTFKIIFWFYQACIFKF